MPPLQCLLFVQIPGKVKLQRRVELLLIDRLEQADLNGQAVIARQQAVARYRNFVSFPHPKVGLPGLQVKANGPLPQLVLKETFRLPLQYARRIGAQRKRQIRAAVIDFCVGVPLRPQSVNHLPGHTGSLPRIRHHIGQPARKPGSAHRFVNEQLPLRVKNRQGIANIYRCRLPGRPVRETALQVKSVYGAPVYAGQNVPLIVQFNPTVAVAV